MTTRETTGLLSRSGGTAIAGGARRRLRDRLAVPLISFEQHQDFTSGVRLQNVERRLQGRPDRDE